MSLLSIAPLVLFARCILALSELSFPTSSFLCTGPALCDRIFRLLEAVCLSSRLTRITSLSSPTLFGSGSSFVFFCDFFFVLFLTDLSFLCSETLERVSASNDFVLRFGFFGFSTPSSPSPLRTGTNSDDFVRLHALSGLHSLAQLQLGFESRGSNSDGLRA